ERIAAPRDTIVFGTPLDGDSAWAEDAAPARPSRWAEPFAVRSSGSVAARPPAREVVWLHPDTARELAAASASAGDGEEADSAASGDEVELDTASAAPPRRARTAARDTPSDGGDRDAETRPSRRTSARDTAASEERPARRTSARRDTADAEEPRPTRRTVSREDSSDDERPARPAATTGGARARTHTVAPGETFYGIARKYGVTSAQLRALNPDVQWQNVEAGDVLRLPASARTPSQPASSGTSGRTASGNASREGSSSRTAQPSTRRRTHTVERGETLFGLARRYGVTVEAIRRANDMDEDAGLRIGQTVVIPPAPRPR
ncbi:MAG TPA: LysM peptidoglycan-binding domain-containing protein, partial [Longimicrobium sp.]|nr:LysM peptidoglycan-binding domain-containing protein [Longimicrobium sp.]